MGSFGMVYYRENGICCNAEEYSIKEKGGFPEMFKEEDTSRTEEKAKLRIFHYIFLIAD